MGELRGIFAPDDDRALAFLAVPGYLLGGCDSGNGVPSFSGEVPTGALPEVTITRPEVTVPTIPTLPTLPTVPTRPETTEATTTGAAPETTVQPPTTTQIERTTVVETVTAPSTTTSPPATGTETNGSQTVAVEPTSTESGGTPWGWLIFALILLGAAAAVRRRRRS